MEKIIIEIMCPASAKAYDFRISKKLMVSEGIEKIISEIRSFEHNEAMLSGDELSLFSERLGGILNKKMSFGENGVKSGDTLMII